MPEKRSISVGAIVEDLRAGMTALELMTKYALTPVQLESIFQQLERLAAKPSKLYGRGPSEDDRLTEKRIRVLPRHRVAVPVRLRDLAHPETKGVVRDISEKGIGTEGFRASVDEIRSFEVLADEFFAANPFQLEAKCRWTKSLPPTRQYIAGFQILNISERNLRELRRFIDCIGRTEQAVRDSPSPAPAVDKSLSQESSGAMWVCPFCKMPQTHEFDECPQCGIIGSKYMQRLEKTKTEVLALFDKETTREEPPAKASQTQPSRQARTSGKEMSLEKPPAAGKEQFVQRSIYVSANLWRELETLEGNITEHINKALSSYLLRAKVGRLNK
jgi:hypothetical protein